MTTANFPPKNIWNNQAELIKWRQENFKETYDKTKSWVRGFMIAGKGKKW